MEVNVNGEYIELGDSDPAITKKSIDISNPGARFVSFTNRFKVPYTNKNARIFESPNAVGSNNRALGKLLNVSIYDVFKIFQGKGFIESATKDYFNLQVVDSSIDVFKALDTALNTIAWDDKDTLLTTAQIDALDSADINNCWFWGKACYHVQALQINTDQTTGDARCKYSRPAFYVQGLLNRAVELLGYSIVMPEPKLAISSNDDHFYFTTYQKTFNQTFNVSGTLNITGLDTYDFKHAAVTVTSTTVKGLKKFFIRIRGHVTTTAPVMLHLHAVDQTGNKVINNCYDLPADGEINFTTTEIYDGPTGMTVNAYFEGTGTVVFTNVIAYSNVDEQIIDLSTNPFLDCKIKAYDMLPDMTYLDLLKLLCVISNAYPVVNSYTKTITFESLSNLNKLKSKDWSDKFIIGSEIISANFKNLFQKNWLKYENDSTVAFDLGWYNFLTDNESLLAEGDYLSLKFSASKENVVNGNIIAQVNVYNDTTRIETPKVSRRLFAIVDDKLQFNPINWEHLATTVYKNYLNCLYRIRAIDVRLNLSKLDVLEWEQKQLVYIDYFKTTFMVLEISSFIPGRPTKVKLLAYGRTV